MINPLQPILTEPQLAELDALLQNLLQSLTPEDWQRQTSAGEWTIKDVAAHLLDGNLRGIAVLRDGYFGQNTPVSPGYTDLVHFLNTLNADWIKAARRLSPQQLIELLADSGETYRELLAKLDPWAPAVFSVAWAGEASSPNWFHVAREYTEKWHHQQQIRQVVGQEAALFADHLYQPYLATSLRALPYHYRQVTAAVGSILQIIFTGAGAGQWVIVRQPGHWEWLEAPSASPTAQITLDGHIAWRIFSKGITPTEAAAMASIQGEKDLAEPFFRLIAVMG